MSTSDDSRPTVRPSTSDRQRMFWSVRRELWENRSIAIAPLAVAFLVLFASLAAVATVPRRLAAVTDPSSRHIVLMRPFSLAAAVIMFTTFLVGILYSLDALHGERRDRSILFWKSLPVSDRMTVLAKLSVPMVVLPAIALALSVAAQMILTIALVGSLAGHGIGASLAFHELNFFEGFIVKAYGLGVHVLWFAPVTAFFLFLSVWARRSPILWAVIPPLALAAVERITLGTSEVGAFLRRRFLGAMPHAFVGGGKTNGGIIDRLDQLTPIDFLTTPALWIGLALTAAFVVAAVELRRHRGPI